MRWYLVLKVPCRFNWLHSSLWSWTEFRLTLHDFTHHECAKSAFFHCEARNSGFFPPYCCNLFAVKKLIYIIFHKCKKIFSPCTCHSFRITQIYIILQNMHHCFSSYSAENLKSQKCKKWFVFHYSFMNPTHTHKTNNAFTLDFMLKSKKEIKKWIRERTLIHFSKRREVIDQRAGS